MTKARVWKNRVSVVCPACKEIEVNNGFDADGDIAGVHEVPFIGASVAWQFNNDLERPTLSPSLLRKMTFGDPPTTYVCHTFITDGRIQYLSDCTHRFAGQTIDLPEIKPFGEHRG